MSSRRLLLLLGIVIVPIRAVAQAAAPIIVQDTSVAGRRAVMKEELSKMAEAQASHFARHKKYAANMTPTRPSTRSSLFLQVTGATATGWSAVATSLADTSLHCGIFEGTGLSPNAAVTRARTPECWGGTP